MIEINSIWHQITQHLENHLNRPSFETFLGSAKPISVSGGTLLIGVPNSFSRDFLEERCLIFIESLLSNLGNGGTLRAKVEIVPELFLGNPPLPAERMPLPKSSSAAITLNPRYTFDSFVVGHGNRFAHAAALAVAETPAKAYNPLFIYGTVGLGKTHLMQAIGHFAAKSTPQAKILYVHAEQFTNEVINSIRDDRTGAFRNRYRGTDILLVDDIQFLAGKERTKEEFFHTFNTLHEASKQIVLSSDRPPKEIPTLEERLRSRFEWGLMADIQPPDLETRIAILKKKAENEELTVSDEVMNLIATRITSNIRELEGALIRIVAYSSLTGTEVTLPVAEEVLRDILSPRRDKPLSISIIKKLTAEYYSIRLDDMSAKIRTREIATARQVAMYLARELTPASLPKIGDEFGGRDHTTVLYACEKIKGELKDNPDIGEAVRVITANLNKYAL